MVESILLPSNVRPRKYDLTIDPDLNNFTFKGNVTIHLDVLEPTQTIKFHAEKLDIQNVQISNVKMEEIITVPSESSTLDYDTEFSTILIQFSKYTLPVGEAVLKIEYSGIISDNMAGFYRSSYVLNGEKKWLAVTQFEPISARLALPCWDEPALKAIFSVSMVAPPGMIALSNMPAVSTTTLEHGSVLYKFADSPVMSTYLLAFAVGNFEKVSTNTKEGVEVCIYSTPGKKEQGQFALETASSTLSFFNDYFGTPYPLPKCDFIAVPDFAMGAMENWGLITFREALLLVVEGSTSASMCQRVASVVAHELAHQWFGNLVTMQWWNDLWLNEGFATWVAELGVNHLHPEWNVWTQFINSDLSRAMATDALLSSHPIEVPIHDPREISQVFDSLSYSKGACIIRQLEAFVSSDVFKKALQAYLSKHKYSNTVTDDLWNSISEIYGQDLKSMMSSWTSQMGFPLLTVSFSEPEASPTEPNAPSKLILRQSRFLSKGIPTPEEDDKLWEIPVTAISCQPGSDTYQSHSFLLTAKESPAPDSFVFSENGWLKFNAGQTGIYRVNYPPPIWKALNKAVENFSLPLQDRLGIAMDSFALSKAGILKSSQALDTFASFQNETDYTIWSQISQDLGEIETVIDDTDLWPSFEFFGQKLYDSIGKKMGWEALPDESHLNAMLRPIVLQKLANFSHESTIAKCKQQFELMVKDVKLVDGNLRRMVLSSAVRYGGKEEYDHVLNMLKHADTHDFKIQCIVALGQTREEDLVNDFLDFGMSSEEIKTQDFLYLIMSMASNPSAKHIMWKTFKQNWERIYGRYSSTKSLLPYIVGLTVKAFSSFEMAEEIEEFFEANPVKEASMELQRSLEAVRSRATWLQRDHDDMASWLAKFKAASV